MTDNIIDLELEVPPAIDLQLSAQAAPIDLDVSTPSPPGSDGREVEFNKSSTHVQWRYVGDSTWIDLIPLSELVGPPGNTVTALGYTAAEVLSGHRLVVSASDGDSTVEYADQNDISDLGKPLWLTLGAALQGASVELLAYGPVVEPSWSWTPASPVYASTSGMLTQTVPTTGYLRIIGYATAPDTLWFYPQLPIILT